MNYYGYELIRESDLAHHGIKGQKWGQRRFQNEDGTWTAAGKERYGDGGSGYSKIGKSQKQLASSSGGSSKSVNWKTVAKVGAAVAGTALVAYGAYKLNSEATKALMTSYTDVGKVFANSAHSQAKIASMHLDYADKAKLRGSNDLKERMVSSAKYATKLADLDKAEANRLISKGHYGNFTRKERLSAAAKIATKGRDSFISSKKEEIFKNSQGRIGEGVRKLHGW